MDLVALDKALSGLDAVCLEESARLFHGRGRCHPGWEQVTIDWFEPVVLITLFKEQQGFDPTLLCEHLLAVLSKNYPSTKIEAVVFQDRSKKVSESKLIYGKLDQECFAKESGLRYHVDVMSFQNVGFFLDAKNARSYVSELSQGKKVLNLFAFTCSFSVAAMHGGASSVVNLDMGKGVLDRGRLNHALNGIDEGDRRVSYIRSDLFKAWKKLHKYGRYDLVVIDPPSFQKGSFNAEKDYAKIVKNLHRLLSNEADIIACLNSPFLSESFLDELFLNGPLNRLSYCLSKVRRLENPDTFLDEDPDSGLKVVHYRYHRLEGNT